MNSAVATQTALTTPSIVDAYIPAIDGLRAVSIILVMAGHSMGGSDRSFVFRALFLHSLLGVNVFFVISGFLITRLLFTEQSQSGTVSLLLFYLRRALRILPACFLFIGTVAVLSALEITPIPGRFWPYVLTYTVDILPAAPWPVLHLWSLSVEEQFYTFWPLFIKLFSVRTCRVIAGAVVFSAIPTQALHHFLGWEFSHYVFPYVSGPIGMGALLALSAERAKQFFSHAAKWGDRRITAGLVASILLLDTIPNKYGLASAILVVFINGLLTFLVSTILFIPCSAVSGLLRGSFMVWLGKLSYSLYLWQQLFLSPVRGAIPIVFPLNFVATFAAAMISYYCVEMRFSSLRRKFRTTTVILPG